MFGKNKDLTEDTVKYFSINREEDFIQKNIRISNIEVEDGNYGKQLKLTVSKDEASAYNWLCGEPGPDKELPGGTVLTTEKQIKTAEQVVLHIARRFDPSWTIPVVKSFDELVSKLVADTKDKWETTPLNAKFEINKKGYAGLAKFTPILEIEGTNKLYITDKDRTALAEKAAIKPDVETGNDAETNSAAPTDDLPF